MSAALSLLDDEGFDDQRRTAASSSLSREEAPRHDAERAAMDPDMLRDRERISLALKPGGVSIALLIFSTLVASPAIWQCLVRNAISVTTMLERWVVITLGCWLLAELARRFGPRLLARLSAPAASSEEESAAEKKAREYDETPVAGFDEGWANRP